MTSQVDALLEEAQRLYDAGDPHGALDCWARVLALVPAHRAATQYTAFVQQVLTQIPSTTTTTTDGYDSSLSALTPPPTMTLEARDHDSLASATATLASELESTPAFGTTNALVHADAHELSSSSMNLQEDPAAPPGEAPPAETAGASSVVATTDPLLAAPWESLVDAGDDSRLAVDDVVLPTGSDPGSDGEEVANPDTPHARSGEVSSTAVASTSAADTVPAASPRGAPDPAPPKDPSGPTLFPAGVPEERVVRNSIRFDEPTPMTAFLRTASLAPTPVELPLSTTAAGVPRAVSEALFPAGLPEERVARQSIRFDELAAGGRTRPQPPAIVAAQAAPVHRPADTAATTTRFSSARDATAGGANSAAPSDDTFAEDISIAVDVGSPWDEHPGPATTLDLDARPSASLERHGSVASPGAPLAGLPLDQPRIETPPMPSTGPDAGLSTPFEGKTTPVRGDDPLRPVDSASVDTRAGHAAALDALMAAARQLFDLGDFSGSLERVEQVLALEPNHSEARDYLHRNEATLTKMFESKLGDLNRAPRTLMRADEVIWMNMHHRAGFVLSRVDGTLSFDDLIEVAGIKRLDAVRILATLLSNGIIG
jgi:hypothetical protein